MGECGISIAAVIQKETDEEAKAAEIVMMTHPSKERQMDKALKILTTLEVVKGIGSFFRVEK